MNNKYIILTAMYRYGILFMEDKPSIEQIKHTLTTTNPHTVIPGSKLMVKKALSDNFGVKNRSDMDQVISELMQGVLTDAPLYSALIDIFSNHLERFISLTQEQVEAYLANGNKGSEYIQPFSPLWEEFQLAVDMNDHLDGFKDAILQYFSPEASNELTNLNDLFQTNQAWLTNTGGLSMAAFNLSRIISIIADAQLCGYVTDEEAEHLLQLYGSVTESLFKDWGAFLFSAILGKQMMSGASGAYIIDSSDYVQSCYKLAAHPSKMLEVSGVWVGSDLNVFCKQISSGYDLSLNEAESQVGESDPKFGFVQSTIMPIFRKYGVEYLFDYEMCDLEYQVPVADMTSNAFHEMTYFLRKTKFNYDADEIPFMVNAKFLMTNKCIRTVEKKMFSKKIHTFHWGDKLDFSYELTLLDLIGFKVNGKIAFNMPRNYKKAGISKAKDVHLDKESVLKYYSEDIQNALRAFSELNDVLGKR